MNFIISRVATPGAAVGLNPFNLGKKRVALRRLVYGLCLMMLCIGYDRHYYPCKPVIDTLLDRGAIAFGCILRGQPSVAF